MILAGDVGGTKTVLALFEGAGADLRTVREARFSSQAHASFDELVAAFLAAGSERPRAACFGVAGPVVGERARITNLPWVIDAAALRARFDLGAVALLNDLQAAAYGALHLPERDLAVLQPGADPTARGHIAVIAPGTGLGEAILFWDGARHHAIGSEGGHADFAPQSDREVRLLVHLRERFGHVSWERVLSGPGLSDLYDFLRDVEGLAEPPELAARLAEGDRNAAITEQGLAGDHALPRAALATFARLLGAEAGNLALKCYAMGGIILAGGIPPKILRALRDGAFLEGLHDKGRFGAFTASIPVRVALDPRTPLLGAAHHIAGRE